MCIDTTRKDGRLSANLYPPTEPDHYFLCPNLPYLGKAYTI